MAHLPAYILHPLQEPGSGIQGDAGADEAFVSPFDARRLHQAVGPAKRAAQAAVLSLLFPVAGTDLDSEIIGTA